MGPNETALPGPDQLDIATRIVFYTAAQYNTLFSHPTEYMIRCWASVFDLGAWITVGLAEAAVHAHFQQSTDGDMAPGHVVRQAKNISGRI